MEGRPGRVEDKPVRVARDPMGYIAGRILETALYLTIVSSFYLLFIFWMSCWFVEAAGATFSTTDSVTPFSAKKKNLIKYLR